MASQAWMIKFNYDKTLNEPDIKTNEDEGILTYTLNINSQIHDALFISLLYPVFYLKYIDTEGGIVGLNNDDKLIIKNGKEIIEKLGAGASNKKNVVEIVTDICNHIYGTGIIFGKTKKYYMYYGDNTRDIINTFFPKKQSHTSSIFSNALSQPNIREQSIKEDIEWMYPLYDKMKENIKIIEGLGRDEMLYSPLKREGWLNNFRKQLDEFLKFLEQLPKLRDERGGLAATMKILFDNLVNSVKFLDNMDENDYIKNLLLGIKNKDEDSLSKILSEMYGGGLKLSMVEKALPITLDGDKLREQIESTGLYASYDVIKHVQEHVDQTGEEVQLEDALNNLKDKVKGNKVYAYAMWLQNKMDRFINNESNDLDLYKLLLMDKELRNCIGYMDADTREEILAKDELTKNKYAFKNFVNSSEPWGSSSRNSVKCHEYINDINQDIEDVSSLLEEIITIWPELPDGPERARGMLDGVPLGSQLFADTTENFLERLKIPPLDDNIISCNIFYLEAKRVLKEWKDFVHIVKGKKEERLRWQREKKKKRRERISGGGSEGEADPETDALLAEYEAELEEGGEGLGLERTDSASLVAEDILTKKLVEQGKALISAQDIKVKQAEDMAEILARAQAGPDEDAEEERVKMEKEMEKEMLLEEATKRAALEAALAAEKGREAAVGGPISDIISDSLVQMAIKAAIDYSQLTEHTAASGYHRRLLVPIKYGEKEFGTFPLVSPQAYFATGRGKKKIEKSIPIIPLGHPLFDTQFVEAFEKDEYEYINEMSYNVALAEIKLIGKSTGESKNPVKEMVKEKLTMRMYKLNQDATEYSSVLDKLIGDLKKKIEGENNATRRNTYNIHKKWMDYEIMNIKERSKSAKERVDQLRDAINILQERPKPKNKGELQERISKLTLDPAGIKIAVGKVYGDSSWASAIVDKRSSGGFQLLEWSRDRMPDDYNFTKYIGPYISCILKPIVYACKPMSIDEKGEQYGTIPITSIALDLIKSMANALGEDYRDYGEILNFCSASQRGGGGLGEKQFYTLPEFYEYVNTKFKTTPNIYKVAGIKKRLKDEFRHKAIPAPYTTFEEVEEYIDWIAEQYNDRMRRIDHTDYDELWGSKESERPAEPVQVVDGKLESIKRSSEYCLEYLYKVLNNNIASNNDSFNTDLFNLKKRIIDSTLPLENGHDIQHPLFIGLENNEIYDIKHKMVKRKNRTKKKDRKHQIKKLENNIKELEHCIRLR